MSAKDSQFIERALVHPWMFWVFFWKWPRIVRQICSEYDLVAKDRDAAKAAHEQAVAANEKVRKWIHVTHQLDATADLRAIWTAGKRLSILLVFFVVTNTYGQAPPYLRNQWTTNANPLALKVISTNGVHAATNVWELDFTNTATVTVSAVSNASKVMVSFTGSASSGSSSLTNALLHAGPTNGSVSPLILTAGNGVTLATSGTNRVVGVSNSIVLGASTWTNFSYPAVAGAIVGVADVNTSGVSVASFGANFIPANGEPAAVVSLGAFAGTPDDGFSSYNIFNIGGYSGFNQVLTNDASIFNIGDNAGALQKVTNSSSIFNLGSQSGFNQKLNDVLSAFSLGTGAGNLQNLNQANYGINMGFSAGSGQTLDNSTYYFNMGTEAGLSASLKLSDYVNNFGVRAGAYLSASNSHYIFNYGYEAAGASSVGNASHITNSRSVFNFGYYTGQKQTVLASTNIYNFGTASGSNAVVNGSWAIYNYGKRSGAESRLTNSYDIYTFGTEAGTNMAGDDLEDIIILGNHVSGASSHQVILGGAQQTNVIRGALQITSGTPGAGKVLTDVAGDGVASWEAASGGSGIASIFTNNVLAGGPGLTELGFTNSSTVSIIATTNAGRVTVSFDASAANSGIATNGGTGWDTSIRSVSTNTVPLRVESEAGLRLTNFLQVATNGGGPFFVISSNKFVGLGTNSPTAPLHVRNIGEPVAANIALFDSFNQGTVLTVKTNAVDIFAGAFMIPSLTLGGDTTCGWYRNAANQWTWVTPGGAPNVSLISSLLRMRSTMNVCWAQSDNSTDSADVGITRNATGVLEINSTSAGTRRDLLARTVTATNFVGNSYSSSATNRIAITATGYTNTMTVFGIAVDVDVYFDAATATLSDPAGNTMHTFQAGTNITVHLKPSWRLAGTTMAGTAIAH